SSRFPHTSAHCLRSEHNARRALVGLALTREMWMIPSVLINMVLALDVLLLGAAQGRGPTRSLAGIKTASCEFTLHAVANWKDGEPQAGLTSAKLSFKFEDINTDEGTARVVGPFGPSDIVVRLSRDTLHFMQSFRDGPLYVTTLIPRIEIGRASCRERV